MESAGLGLEKIVGSSLRRLPVTEAAMAAWPLVCGSAVAERTRAQNFSDGILQVTVPDAAWRRELQSLAARYVASINRYVDAKVSRIEFAIVANKSVSGQPINSVKIRGE